jgi:hypothetical protein
MKIRYCCNKESFFDDIIWLRIETKDEEDNLMEIFTEELILNMKHQFGYNLKMKRI